MADRDGHNGEDPFPSNPVQRRPPLRAMALDDDEPTRAGMHKLYSQVLVLLERFNVMDRDLVALGTSMIDGFVRIENRLALPPMRPELGSGHALVEEAGAQLVDRFKKKADETPGSNVQATPEELARMAQEVFAEETRKLEEKRRLAKLEKDEADRGAAAVSKAERRRTFWALTISGTIAAVAAVIVAAMLARASGHDQGFSEGVRAVPANTVVVPVGMAATEAMSVVPPAPVMSPADAATRRGK